MTDNLTHPLFLTFIGKMTHYFQKSLLHYCNYNVDGERSFQICNCSKSSDHCKKKIKINKYCIISIFLYSKSYLYYSVQFIYKKHLKATVDQSAVQSKITKTMKQHNKKQQSIKWPRKNVTMWEVINAVPLGFTERVSFSSLFSCLTGNFGILVHYHNSHSVIFGHSRLLFSVKRPVASSWWP